MTGFDRWTVIVHLHVEGAHTSQISEQPISANLFNRVKAVVANAFTPAFAPAVA